MTNPESTETAKDVPPAGAGVNAPKHDDNKSSVTSRGAKLVPYWNALKWIVAGIILVLAVDLSVRLLSDTLHPASDEPTPAVRQEWNLASADHEIIATAVAACSKIFNLAAQPVYIRAQLRLDVSPDGRSYRSYSLDRDSKPTSELVLSNFHRAAIYLSDSVARARAEAAGSARSNYSTMFWFQFAIVGIGAITTILISIKSISNSPQTGGVAKWYFGIGIAAIVFSSLGTAASALNSFYGPRENYLRTERSLSALRQLHSDIVAKVTSTVDAADPSNCPKSNPANKDDALGKQVQDWSAKYAAIVTAADNSTSTQSNTATQSGASSGGSSGAPASNPSIPK